MLATNQPISLKIYLVVKAIDLYHDESSLGLITRNVGKVIEQISIMTVKDIKYNNWWYIRKTTYKLCNSLYHAYTFMSGVSQAMEHVETFLDATTTDESKLKP